MDRPGGLSAIGGTPVVRLAHLANEGCAEVWVKMEAANPTGSYKDRMALAMIEAAEADGRLRPGQLVVEYTGGSTGSSLAFVCAVKAASITSAPKLTGIWLCCWWRWGAWRRPGRYCRSRITKRT